MRYSPVASTIAIIVLTEESIDPESIAITRSEAVIHVGSSRTGGVATRLNSYENIM